MADAEARWLVYLRAVSPKEKERYLRPRPKNLSSSNQCLMAAGHSSNPGLFWWQSSGTNRRLLISLICSLTRRSYSRDTSPPLNGHAFGKQRFHNILLCCAEDPSYTNFTLSQTPNLCSTSQILLVHLVKHVSGSPLGRAGCCHISSFFSLHGWPYPFDDYSRVSIFFPF